MKSELIVGKKIFQTINGTKANLYLFEKIQKLRISLYFMALFNICKSVCSCRMPQKLLKIPQKKVKRKWGLNDLKLAIADVKNKKKNPYAASKFYVCDFCK